MHLQRRRTAESRIPTSSSTADVTRLDEVVVSHVPNSPLTRTALPHNNASPSSASTSKLPLPPSIAHHRHRHSRSMNAVPTLHTMTAAEDEDVVVPACAGSRASKLMALPFMRRQMHFKKTKASPPDGGLLSTPAERSDSPARHSSTRSPQPTKSSRSSSSTTRYHSPDLSAQPPTIAQIAMGLHVSRTPHLRPQPRRLHSEPSGSASVSATPSTVEKKNDRRGRSTVPKQPLRSSMKKSPAASLSTSISMSASASPHRLSVASSLTTPPSSIGPVTPSPQSTFSKLSLALGHGNSSGKIKNKLRLFGIHTAGSMSTTTSTSDPSATLAGEEDLPRKSVRFMSVEEDAESSGLGMVSVESEGIMLVSRPDQE